MSLIPWLVAYGAVAVVFFVMDVIWLGLIARRFYAQQLGHLLRPTVDWLAAIPFYAIFLFGLLYFAVAPAASAGSITQAVLSGALFGLVTYATYELTNRALIRDWPAPIVFVDIAWGIVLSAVATVSGYAVMRQFV